MTTDDRGPQRPAALETREEKPDGRRFSPSTGRNKDIVRNTFLKHMPQAGRVLEIASGTGEHGAHITAATGDLQWTYSDIDPDSLVSQAAWAAHEDHDRLSGPITIDTRESDWGEVERQKPLAGLVCINMIHIAPFEATVGLFNGAERLLGQDGKLFLYGPFSRNGVIAPSNARFDDDLKRRDPSWGVRDLDAEIVPLADAAGMTLEQVVEMPANNLSVVFGRQVATTGGSRSIHGRASSSS